MSQLTVIMYHYVREIRRSRYPGIKGLEVEGFKRQLFHLRKRYVLVSLRECVEALDSGTSLPPNSAMLTFDDGYLDHYTSVFPVLAEQKIPGVFFPPGRAVMERKMLDVNKIHYLLATDVTPDVLVRELFSLLDEYREAYSLPANEVLYEELAKPFRYDSAEVIFVKRLLQVRLPVELRTQMVDRLFTKHVSSDEVGFSSELYLTVDQIKHMIACGMELGSHGWNHFWFDSLPPEEQAVEVDRSLEFLRHLGVSTQRWAMCYPYGAYDETTLGLLRERDCALGFTTLQEVATLSRETALVLPRFDTNDFPSS